MVTTSTKDIEPLGAFTASSHVGMLLAQTPLRKANDVIRTKKEREIMDEFIAVNHDLLSTHGDGIIKND